MALKKPTLNFEPHKERVLDLVKLIQSGQFNVAENKAKKLIKQYPNSFTILNLLGLSLINQDQINQGIICYKNAIRIKPNFAEAYNNLGIAFKNIGKIKEAIDCYQNAIIFKSNFAEAHNNLGLMLMEQGKINEAKINFKKALKIKPNLAYIHRHLSIITKYTKNNPHIAEMKKIILDSKSSDNQKMHVAFGLGKVFDDIKDYKNAFKYFEQGNKLRRKKIKYNINDDIFFFKTLKKKFNKNLFANFKNSGNLDKTPIFILGMFRSGSTLVEQILSSHSKVYGGGESKALFLAISKILRFNSIKNFPEDLTDFNYKAFNNIGKLYIEAARKFQPSFDYITDKQPLNLKWIGFIKLVLPNAKIIHCVRKPMDNCLSIYKNYFDFDDNPYSYDLDELGQYYNLYKDLMEYWHSVLPNFIYDISYEKLIENQKEQTRKLLNFCNLKWDNKCMNFFKNKRSVSTASTVQVRKPIYKDSIDSWKRYENYLSVLMDRIK